MTFPWADHRPDDPERVQWDIVVIGAGMGGGLLGAELAREGWKILFLERGPAPGAFPPSPRRGRLGRLMSRGPSEAEWASKGRWGKRVTVRRGRRSRDIQIPLGNGPGGSSAIYGASLGRLLRDDFEGSGRDGISPAPMPNRWPIAYDEFLPYYRRAEQTLHVCGARDPCDPDGDSQLRAPPPLSQRDQQIFRAFEDAGLRPFRDHVGIDYKPGCMECPGELCPRDCKSEGASRGLKEALTSGGAKLITGFEVERLDAGRDHVQEAVGRCEGRRMTIRAKVFVLAAGALATPLILIRSTSPEWPAGIGNDHDLVGRGLMFHTLQPFLMRGARGSSVEGPAKTIASRAFNRTAQGKLGGIQSYFRNVKPGHIAQFVGAAAERALPFRLPGQRLGVRVGALAIATILAPFFRDCAVFAAQSEDFAYPQNRVAPDPKSPSGYAIVYDPPKELQERARLLREELRRHLRGRKAMFPPGGIDLNFGHPAGTCRFGVSPSDSVLDPNGRVHGVDNLYVADASFMPTIGAINPALTVAAHALRVADIIAGALRSDREVGAASEIALR